MKLNFKRLAKVTLLFGVILGVIGGTTGTANARSHHYHYHSYRRVRKHARTNRRKHGYRNKKQNRRTRAKRVWKLYMYHEYIGSFHSYKAYRHAKQSIADYNNPYSKENVKEYDEINGNNSPEDNVKPASSSDINQNLAEMKQQTLTDINNDRQANGVAPLTESPELDQIANMRAQQVISDYEHKDPSTGINYYAEDAQSLGYSNVPNKTLGENIDGGRLGTDHQNNTIRYNKDGNDIANIDDYVMVNDDEPNWGHRRNILKPTQRLIGIGTAYAGNGQYYLAEDFAGASSEVQN